MPTSGAREVEQPKEAWRFFQVEIATNKKGGEPVI